MFEIKLNKDFVEGAIKSSDPKETEIKVKIDGHRTLSKEIGRITGSYSGNKSYSVKTF